MALITAKEFYEVLSVLATNTSLDEIDFSETRLQDVINRDPKAAGRRFTEFLKNGCRFITGEIKAVTTKLFDHTEFLGSGWSIWKGSVSGDGTSGAENVDLRSLSLPKIDLDLFLFETCLKEGENSITGFEKLRRLEKMSKFIRFGDNVFLGLWLDYQTNKENSVLETFYRTRGVIYLDFFGTIFRSPGGNPHVLYLCRFDDDRWRRRCNWLGRDWLAPGLSAGCKIELATPDL